MNRPSHSDRKPFSNAFWLRTGPFGAVSCAAATARDFTAATEVPHVPFVPGGPFGRDDLVQRLAARRDARREEALDRSA